MRPIGLIEPSLETTVSTWPALSIGLKTSSASSCGCGLWLWAIGRSGWVEMNLESGASGSEVPDSSAAQSGGGAAEDTASFLARSCDSSMAAPSVLWPTDGSALGFSVAEISPGAVLLVAASTSAALCRLDCFPLSGESELTENIAIRWCIL